MSLKDVQPDIKEPVAKPTTPGFVLNPGACPVDKVREFFDGFITNPAIVRDTGGLTDDDRLLYEEALKVVESLAPAFGDSVRVIIEGEAGKSVTVYVGADE